MECDIQPTFQESFIPIEWILMYQLGGIKSDYGRPLSSYVVPYLDGFMSNLGLVFDRDGFSMGR